MERLPPPNLDLAPPPASLKHADHEQLLLEIQEHAKNHGYAVTKLRSKKSKTDVLCKIWLCCDRGRKIREPRGHKRKHVNTRANDCPFQVVMVRSTRAMEQDWKLVISNAQHNHDGTPPTTHPSLRRLAMNEHCSDTILDEMNTKQTLLNITSTLRVEEEDQSLRLIMRDIYNKRRKLKCQSLGALSPTQALLKWLEEEDWHVEYRKDHITNELTHLFFARPSSIELLRHNWEVLSLGCSHDTNKFMLPLLAFCGVTALNTTFYAAFAFIRGEEEVDYVWALRCLEDLLHHENIKNPLIAITNRELALMNALAKVFLRTHHLLCIWHINEEVSTQCKQAFSSSEELDTFLKHWQRVIHAPDVNDHESEWTSLQEAYEDRRSEILDLVNYLQDTWMNETMKYRFLACHTNMYTHFRNTVTSRFENAHRRIERTLPHSTGDLKSVVDELEHIMKGQWMEFTARWAQVQDKVQMMQCTSFLNEIKSLVSPYALTLVMEQGRKIQKLGENEQLPPCTGTFRSINGLPCAHEIQKVFHRESKRFSIQDIHTHWRYKQSPSYSMRYLGSKSNDAPIDPFLQIEKPAVGQPRGRPRGRGSKGQQGRGSRAQQAFDATARRISAQFEEVEEELQRRSGDSRV